MEPGSIGELRLVRMLGQGTMGEVWLAEDTLLERQVAIKFPRARRGGDDLPRFQIEARALGRVRHPNVVVVHHAGRHDGRPYLVTELLTGKTLAELGRPVAVDEVIRIGIGMARGLAAVHRVGVLHRDLKPGNVFVCDDGTVKLVDFGLAKLSGAEAIAASSAGGAETAGVADTLDDAGAGPGVTRPGALLGTPLYLAPELWRDEPQTRRSDVYALGALLHELLAGHPPYPAKTLHALREAVTTGDRPPVARFVPSAPAPLAALIERCLAGDAAARPTADEVREALEAMTGGGEPAVEDPGGDPYRGLAAFDAGDRALFFGREPEIRAIVEELRRGPLVVVAAPSGQGKSSVVRAGVVPAIRAGALGPGHEVIVVTPADPLPAASDSPLVVVIDQLEEAVTVLSPDRTERFAEALQALLAAAPQVRVLATIRSDYLGRLEELGPIAAELLRGVTPLPPLGPEAMRRAVVEPAARRGYRFEDDALVDQFVAAAEPGALPLIAFALAELWRVRDHDRRVLGAAGLARIGGITGALARHGDAVLAAMAPPVRDAARRVLLDLISADGTRARRTAAELGAESGAARAALDALVDGRLVVAALGEQGAIHEVAHEALLSGWPALRDWIAAEAQARATLDRLRRAAAEWERLGHSAGLFGRRQLAELEGLPVGAAEAGFVRASRAAERARRVRWWALRAGVPLLIAAVVAGAIAATRWQRRRADRDFVAARVAEARRGLLEADRLESAALALRDQAFAAFDRGESVRGEAIWDDAAEASRRAERAFGDAAAAIDVARSRDPGDRAARALGAEVTYRWLLSAERDRDADLAAELSARLAALDDGAWAARLHAPATLRVTTVPPGAAVTIDGTSDLPATLPAGSYLLRAGATAFPVLLERGATHAIAIELADPARIPPGFVHVPAGRSIVGDAAPDPVRRYLTAQPAHPVDVPGFLIAIDEVTAGAYDEFLAALPPAERARHAPRDPATPGGATVPVVGVSWEDGRAYARWLDATGRVPRARLCREHEWERAARGADGRAFPWGDDFAPGDANIGAGATLAPVGSFPRDTSVFGVRDLAGNARELVDGVIDETRPHFKVVRGSVAGEDPSPLSMRDWRLLDKPVDATIRVCADL